MMAFADFTMPRGVSADPAGVARADDAGAA